MVEEFAVEAAWGCGPSSSAVARFFGNLDLRRLELRDLHGAVRMTLPLDPVPDGTSLSPFTISPPVHYMVSANPAKLELLRWFRTFAFF